MQYDKEKIYEEAIKICHEKKPLFIEHLVAFLPISKFTFYNYFKVDSNEYNELKEIIETNKINRKSAMINNWVYSESSALQISAYKLLGTSDEVHRLSGTRTENKNENNNIHKVVWGEEPKQD